MQYYFLEDEYFGLHKWLLKTQIFKGSEDIVLAYFNLRFKRFKRFLNQNSLDFINWYVRGFSPPSPQKVKLKILIKNSIKDAPWIETGTYLGETTSVLAKKFTFVDTLEPSPLLYKYNTRRFKGRNIEVHNQSSEEGLEFLIKKRTGRLNLWLDGHASGDITWHGSFETPIEQELRVISENLNKFDEIFIAIDDFRAFEGLLGSYPSKDYLVFWALKNNLLWSVEHDIFLLKKPT